MCSAGQSTTVASDDSNDDAVVSHSLVDSEF